MDAGIDKIVLTTRNFSIKDVSILGQNRNIPQGKTEEDLPVLGIDTGFGHMEMIRANGAYYNDVNGLYNLSVNKTGAQVIFNPSKVLHPYNLVTDIREVKKVGEAITNALRQHGILLNLETCNVSRLDLAKQEVMTRSIRTYSSAFNFMQGKRMTSTGYENGYRFGNKQTEATFYDKGIESNLPIENLMRCEPKFKTTQAVQKRSGIKSYGDILHSDSGHLTDIYNRYLNNVLFDRNVSYQTTLNFEQEVDKLKYFRSIMGRNAVMNYLICNSIDSLTMQFGSIEVLFEIMAKAGFKRNQIYKQRKQIYTIMQSADSGRVSEISIPQLINELQQKFAA